MDAERALVTGKWLDSDGSLSGITRTITDGVPKPRSSAVKRLGQFCESRSRPCMVTNKRPAASNANPSPLRNPVA